MDEQHTDKQRDTQDQVTSGTVAKTVAGTVGLFFLELIKVALLAGVTIALVRYFLFKPFYVKGQSMEPSYYAKEYLIIDEITYRFREPERGEVVVFKAPFEKDDYYIKRVLGLPGERVKIEDGKVIIYNEQYPEGVVTEERYLEEKTPGSINVSLGPDQYFVMGDNRDESFDSRRFGPVSRDAIVGRTWLRGWPVPRGGLFQKPQYNL